ncbi:hypothetical protein AWB75_04153 [Caballeronia catudaia]|uniref:TIR domain-containing protein n=1 Tax=Caballeronia catudaia TaxID=1777136 RepID=A0A158BX06_9BURK|nr:hypothetical protein [Caballeronia catudaia]SAK74510.1 hypothetical protein AWB75_04153 [Caballeronia catudaia]
MFRAFNLEGVDAGTFESWKEDGDALFSNQKKSVQNAISLYIQNDAINGLKVKGDWFGQTTADVFISHSHSDEKIAIGMAGWLRKTFGLTAFIDSCVWGHANDLLRTIDNQYCKLNATTYSYDLRNRSTSHVHMMLSTALTQMIDSCECVVFLNTPSAVSTEELLEKDSDGQTSSPWIYAELVTMQVIRRRKPGRPIRRTMTKASREGMTESMDSIDVQYPLYLNDLTALTVMDLNKWAKAQRIGQHALDTLYDIKPESVPVRETFGEIVD